jgi:hypothetical protein
LNCAAQPRTSRPAHSQQSHTLPFGENFRGDLTRDRASASQCAAVERKTSVESLFQCRTFSVRWQIRARCRKSLDCCVASNRAAPPCIPCPARTRRPDPCPGERQPTCRHRTQANPRFEPVTFSALVLCCLYSASLLFPATWSKPWLVCGLGGTSLPGAAGCFPTAASLGKISSAN